MKQSQIQKGLLALGIPLLLMAFFGTAHAQSMSGRGIDNESVIQADCKAEVERLETVASSLETFYGNLQGCNDQGKVFDGSGCADLVGLEHEWLPNASNPTQLVLKDGATEVARINVIRGKAGRNATAADCPAGTAP